MCGNAAYSYRSFHSRPMEHFKSSERWYWRAARVCPFAAYNIRFRSRFHMVFSVRVLVASRLAYVYAASQQSHKPIYSRCVRQSQIILISCFLRCCCCRRYTIRFIQNLCVIRSQFQGNFIEFQSLMVATSDERRRQRRRHFFAVSWFAIFGILDSLHFLYRCLGADWQQKGEISIFSCGAMWIAMNSVEIGRCHFISKL